MNKEQFLKKLRRKLLFKLSAQEISDALAFYSELIGDGVESGKTEEEVIASLGNIDDIAARIIGDCAAETAKRPMSGAVKVLIIIALILGSPIWISVLAAIFSCVVAVAAVLFAAIVTLFALCFSLAVGFIAGIVSFCFLVSVNPLGGVFQLGAGILSLGLALLLFYGMKNVVTSLWKVIKRVVTAPINYFKKSKGGFGNV